MHPQNSMSGSFKNFLEEKRNHLVEIFEAVDTESDYYSDWQLESYCYLSSTILSDLKSGYLPQSLKQCIVFGDIVYEAESPEETYKSLEFINFIETNFNTPIQSQKLSPDFLQRLRFDKEYFSTIFHTAELDENSAIHIHALVKALNKLIPLPVFSITKEYLYKTCIKYISDGYEQVELALYQHILKSEALTHINFEPDEEKKIMRYNGFLCSLINDIKIKEASPIQGDFFREFSSAFHVNKILSTNAGDFIRGNSSFCSLIYSSLPAYQSNHLKKVEQTQFI